MRLIYQNGRGLVQPPVGGRASLLLSYEVAQAVIKPPVSEDG